MSAALHRCETLVIGAGLAGISTALELLDQGREVLLLDAAPRSHSRRPGQRCLRRHAAVRHARAAAQQGAGFAAAAARRLAARGRLRARRSLGAALGRALCRAQQGGYLRLAAPARRELLPGGAMGGARQFRRWQLAAALPRGLGLRARDRPDAGPADVRARQAELPVRTSGAGAGTRNGAVVGRHGRGPEGDFRIEAEHVVVCSGGINGDLAKVRQHWDPLYGPFPENILNGTDPRADGELHAQVQAAGGQVVKLGRMWNYAAGIAHPEPQYPQHGLSLIPSRSALWLDATGRRIGPQPLVGGFDTHDQCKRIGQLPGQYGWQLLNWRIAIKEMAISGTDSNPYFRDRKLLRLLWQLVTGNRELVRWLIERCPDVLAAENLPQLAGKMAALAGDGRLDPNLLVATVQHYDAGIRRGPSLYNDEQLRRLQQLRQWRGDRLRTCRVQPIMDSGGGPLIAIRTRLISRKSMGGMLTDLHSRVLDAQGEPVSGPVCSGEAAGFGGGGISGIRSLEGTFLSNCILNGRRAAQAIAGHATNT
ncbi:FAD-binding protein [Stutzerimonas sp. CQPMC-PStu]|uniref:FAD-binding protein n=1 Tax=Stutzerimonas sp. CQPMC-PStu TaxID=3369415 RepID=UPI0037172B8E